MSMRTRLEREPVMDIGVDQSMSGGRGDHGGSSRHRDRVRPSRSLPNDEAT